MMWKTRERISRQDQSKAHSQRSQSEAVGDSTRLALSTLCNLLEEVTKGGWKDLHPLVGSLQWEVDRVTGEQDAYGMLQSHEG
jgi:hypothetical protein